MENKHHYTTNLNWTGNSDSGTSSYKSYERNYEIKINDKPILEGSSDPAFRGDASKYNPEELFLASISSCHMLWYLHLCSVNKVVVLEYEDEAKGEMIESKSGKGRFKKVTLYPKVVVESNSMIEKAKLLHQQANQMCFIANSCNFKIGHVAEVEAKN
ncbi:MAG: OsmC family protein [Balneola sp.]